MVETNETGAATALPIQAVIKLADGRLRRMQLTKGARFEASRRHKFTGRRTAFAIVILSLWIFGLALLALVYSDIDRDKVRFFIALSLILSFFVTAFSLLKSAMRHEVRSELFMKCAQEIDEISTDFSSKYSQIKYKLDTAPDEETVGLLFKLIDSSDQKYQRILTHFTDNHSEIDHKIYSFKTYGKPKVDCGWPEYLKFTLRHFYWKMKLVVYQAFAIIISIALPLSALLEERQIEQWLFADGVARSHSTQPNPISR